MQVKLRVAVTAALIASTGILSAAVAPQAAAQARQRPPSSVALAAALTSKLYGVSCTSASACIAVGDYVTSSGASKTLVERWNGTAWTVQSSPNPSGASYLNGVSCTSTSACTAVGHYVSSGATVTLAERWNGTAWTVQSTPNPSGATASFLLGVSCASASACIAVGYYLSAGAYHALVERWDGTAWTVQSTPTVSGATASFLLGVSCTSASACTATGYSTTSTTEMPLAERWDGTAWAVQSTPSPSDATASYLNGVSCTSASACTGVGWYQTSPGVYETLAERWDGTTWTVQSTPNPSGATASYLFGVSCGSASACTAAGYTLNPNYKALAERWNGTAWALQPTPNP